jgi:hypothetical protein
MEISDMRDKFKKFIQILKIELEESEQDLHFLEDLHKQREEAGEITQYVFRENMNLLKNEISSVREILYSVDDMIENRDDYDSFVEMVDALKRKVKDKVDRSTNAEAVYDIVSRKIDKVLKYVQEES